MGDCSLTESACSLWEKQLKLDPECPISGVVRMRHVIEGLQLGIECLLADAKGPAASRADGHRPLLTPGRLPVGRDDGGTGQIPATREVIVDERLDQHLIHLLAVRFPGDRSNLGYQRAHQPRSMDGEGDCGDSRAELSLTQYLVTGTWENERGAYTPDKRSGCARRRKIQCERNVAHAADGTARG
jgi:hypothetical protein